MNLVRDAEVLSLLFWQIDGARFDGDSRGSCSRLVRYNMIVWVTSFLVYLKHWPGSNLAMVLCQGCWVIEEREREKHELEFYVILLDDLCLQDCNGKPLTFISLLLKNVL